jgi:hypothetical protein
MRALFYDILFVALSIVEVLRTRRSWYKYLGNFFFARASYWPNQIGFGVDLYLQSRDEFELSVDFGPFTVSAGRDWAVEL